MIAIAQKASDQIEEEYPDIDTREKNRLIDERFTKLAQEYKEKFVTNALRSRKGTTMMRILTHINVL